MDQLTGSSGFNRRFVGAANRTRLQQMLFNEFTHEAAAALLAAKFSHARAHAKRKDNAERIVSLGAAALTLGRIFVAFTVLRCGL